MRRLILSFFMLIASCGVLHAETVTFVATVNANQITLDDALQLTLTFTGVNDNLNPISLPALDGFAAKYVGPSSSTSFEFINGQSQSHSERSFIYNLFPNKVGKFQIPAITATVAGQTYTTQPINVEVVSSPVQAPTQAPAQAPVAAATSVPAPADQDQSPSLDSLKDKILIMVAVDKTQVYLNERVPVTIKLLVNNVPVRDIQFPQFDKTGFLVDDFEKPVQGSQVVNGINYDTIVFKTNIYPDRLGDLGLGPVQVQGNIVYKTGQNNPFGQNNNFFGADVFNNFFDSYATRPITINSQPIQLHVSNLPDANRPADFSEAIGQFDFKASVAPVQVKAGDPITLKMDVKGAGNFKNLKLPVFQASGFKTYAPQIKNADGDKSTEEVIIPTSADVKEVPALNFTYFDPSIKDYRTITQGPFPIQVSAPNPDQDFKAVGFVDISRDPSAGLANQFSFGKLFHKIHQFLGKLFKSVGFWIVFSIIVIAAAVYFLWRRFQERLENDPAFARRLKAVREARQALIPAEEFIKAGKTKDFYALISRVLHDYLANKWHRSSAALSVQEIIDQLKKSQLNEAYITQIKTLLEQADLVCFAGAPRDAVQMNADLNQTQSLIAYFEKSLK